jgi:hypothetical protein
LGFSEKPRANWEQLFTPDTLTSSPNVELSPLKKDAAKLTFATRRARRAILNMPWYGLTEHWEDSLCLFFYTFRTAPRPARPYRVKNPRPTDKWFPEASSNTTPLAALSARDKLSIVEAEEIGFLRFARAEFSKRVEDAVADLAATFSAAGHWRDTPGVCEQWKRHIQLRH